MEDVRAVIFIILCCAINIKCYVRPKPYEGFGDIKVIEVYKTDKGFDIIWEDYRGNEHITFANDTSVFHVGYSMKTLIKL